MLRGFQERDIFIGEKWIKEVLNEGDKINSLIKKKYEKLKNIFCSMERVLVAFSGGVDSSLLLKIARDCLGEKNVLAVTAISPLFPERELAQAKKTAQTIGVRHLVIESNELEIEGFSQKSLHRCYLCKKELFAKLKEIAAQKGISFIIEGSTSEDQKDYRPGRTAVRELGIRSPLLEVLFGKEEVRILSKFFHLPTWDKPSFACLASRFPYGEEIDEEKIRMVDKVESYLLSLGFKQVRARHHGDLCRIELLKEEMECLLKEPLREEAVAHIKKMGYVYVSLDLQGFRSGSMNEPLDQIKCKEEGAPGFSRKEKSF